MISLLFALAFPLMAQGQESEIIPYDTLDQSKRLDRVESLLRALLSGRPVLTSSPTIRGIPTLLSGANIGSAPSVSSFSASGQLSMATGQDIILTNCRIFSTGSITCAGATGPWIRNGANVSLVNSGDSVGVGTASPGNKLHVKIDTNLNWRFGYPLDTATSIAALNDAANAYVTGRIDANSLELNSQSGANVGIGAANPGAKLYVSGDSHITTSLTASSVTATAFRISDGTNGSAYPLQITTQDAGLDTNQEIGMSFRQLNSEFARLAAWYDGARVGYRFYGYNGGLNTVPTFVLNGNHAAHFAGGITVISSGTFTSSATVKGRPDDPSLTSDGSVLSVRDNFSITDAQLGIGFEPAGAAAIWLQGTEKDFDGTAYPIKINPAGGNVSIGSGGTPLAVISSGTYTPSCTSDTNVDSCTPTAGALFLRVGNIVFVSGEVVVDPTSAANTDTQFDLSLPVSSGFTTSTDANGSLVTGLAQRSGAAFGDAANDRIQFEFASERTAATTMWFQFMYTVK